MNVPLEIPSLKRIVLKANNLINIETWNARITPGKNYCKCEATSVLRMFLLVKVVYFVSKSTFETTLVSEWTMLGATGVD